jgi:SAM-dependent methyltransferase
MSTPEEKYDALAEGFSEREYAAPEVYSAGRARIFAELGPRLDRGATVFDIACGDGIMAAPLIARGYRYIGLDTSSRMVDVARLRNPGLDFVVGRAEEYDPAEPIDATLCLRSFYFPKDRVAFFRKVASYTKRKFIFDFRQPEHPTDTVKMDLRAAGFTRIEMWPYFVPQRHALPRAAVVALEAFEHTGPLAMLCTRRYGRVFCSASTDDPPA